MKTIELTDADRTIGRCVEEATGDLVLLTRDGRLVAAIVPVGDEDDAETVALKLNPRFVAMLQRSRRSLDAGESLSLQEVMDEFSPGAGSQ